MGVFSTARGGWLKASDSPALTFITIEQQVHLSTPSTSLASDGTEYSLNISLYRDLTDWNKLLYTRQYMGVFSTAEVRL